MAIDKNTIAREAQKYTAKGQYDKAIAEWKKLLKESPHDANLFNTIGDLCLKKNAKAEAVDAYRHAADILAQDGFTSKAIALYKKVLNIDNNQAEVHLALGDMHAEKGLTGNALENYKFVADLYTQQKDMVKALRVYQKMADLNPANIAFRMKLADMYAKQGMKAEAAAAYLSAADVHIEKNADTEARQIFEKVLAFDPNNRQVYFKAGILYLKEGKFNEACKALKPVYEADTENRELADTYVDALSRAGKDKDAEQVISKLLADDPGRSDLREKLFELYVKNRNFDRALEVASALSAASMERDDAESAEGYLRKFIAACPDVPAGRRKLAEFYISVRRDEDAARLFLQAAEITSDEGDRDAAKELLDRALEITPGMPAAIQLLQHLSAEIAPEPAVQETAEPASDRRMPAEEIAIEPPAAEPAEPIEEIPAAQPLAETAAETGDIFPEIPGAAGAIPEPPAETTPSAEQAAPPEDPAIMEAITEADVLVKYGLAVKALEQLENLAKKFPESTTIQVKLQNVYGDMGQMGKAAMHMLALADIYIRRGMQDEANETLRSALAIDPTNNDIKARLGIAPEPQPVSEPFVSPAFTEAPAGDKGYSDRYAPAPTDMDMFEGQQPAPEEPAVIEDITELGSRDLRQAEELAQPEPMQESVPKPPPFEAAAAYQPPAAEKTAQAEPPATTPDIEEIWAEAEFYYQQGLFDEAKKHYAKIIELNPSESRAINRLSEISREEQDTKEFTRLADAVESLEDTITMETGAQELPLTTSDEEAVRNLMSEIAEIKKTKRKPSAAPPPHKTIEVEYIPPPPQEEEPLGTPEFPAEDFEAEEPRFTPRAQTTGRAYTPPSNARGKPPVSAGAPFSPARPAEEEDFFDLGAALRKDTRAPASAIKRSSDDFFDLASELRDELSAVSLPPRPPAHAEEQSLDEIFEEFKRGVEQQTTKEESDTHYNLGVAYREMGLLDDAIEEFSLTPQGEQKFMLSRYMLGLCYMEKGEYVNAIREIEYALTYSEGMGEDEKSRMEMRYDLGLAYQGSGNITSALREFQIVQRVNPQYRDVAVKLRESQQGQSVSISRLKGDIEKEISSKFLVEGERIEREEKSRKNDRIRR
jgi:pilus assembly protein FimV